MKQKKVTVIIPVYNGEKELARNYKSICAMGYQNLEIIYIDDSSTDQSQAVAESISQQDSRIKLLCKEKNEGPAAARNAGLDVATGEYVLFYDVDDSYEPTALSQMVSAMEEYGADCVIGDVYRIDKNGKKHAKAWKEASQFISAEEATGVLKEFLLDERNNRILCSVWGKLFRRSTIEEKHIRFDESMRVYEDELFFFQFFTAALNSYYLHEYVYTYYRNGSNTGTSSLPNPLGFEKHLNVIRDYISKFALPDEKETVERLYGNAYCEYLISACYNIVRVSKAGAVSFRQTYRQLSSMVNEETLRKNLKYYLYRNKDNLPFAIYAIRKRLTLLVILSFRYQIKKQSEKRNTRNGLRKTDQG